MNLREAMGAVRAGKKVRFHVVTPYGIQALTSEDLDHTEFHVVEEPPRCTDAHSTPACCATRADDRATIARLTRELADAEAGDREQRQACARLSLRVAELEPRLASCCSCCICARCQRERQMAAMGNQGCCR
jgi:hypothetical protein